MSREAFGALASLLEARSLGGYVRHCHGDLHLHNIGEIDGVPTLFDAIEFDDVIATVDVLYDLALRMFGVNAEDRLPESAYTAEVSDIVYGICRKRGLMAFEGGQTLIVDALHTKKDERDAIAKIAARVGAAFTGIWLDTPADTMRQRIARRTGDVSYATPDVLNEQLGFDLGPQEFTVVYAVRSTRLSPPALRSPVLPMGRERRRFTLS